MRFLVLFSLLCSKFILTVNIVRAVHVELFKRRILSDEITFNVKWSGIQPLLSHISLIYAIDVPNLMTYTPLKHLFAFIFAKKKNYPNILSNFALWCLFVYFMQRKKGHIEHFVYFCSLPLKIVKFAILPSFCDFLTSHNPIFLQTP